MVLTIKKRMQSSERMKKPMAETNKKKNPPAKKKTATKNQTAKNNSAKSAPMMNRQRNSIILMAIAVILLFIALIEGQSVWQFMHNSLYGIFGFVTFLVPIYLIYAAFAYSKETPRKGTAANIVGIGIILTLISAAVHIGFGTKEYFTDTSLGQQIADVWAAAPTLKSGGVLGAIFGGLIALLFGKTPAMLTVIVLTVLTFLLITGISIEAVVSAVKKPVKKVGEITSEKLEQNAQKRERLAAEREAREQEQKKFAPPAKPTVSVDDDEDFGGKIVTEESTFASGNEVPAEDVVITFTPEEDYNPEIPVIKLPDATESNVVEEVVEEVVKEKKRRTKAPQKPDGDPIEGEDDAREFPDGEEKKEPEYIFPPIDCLRYVEKSGATENDAETQLGARKLISTLESFKINCKALLFNGVYKHGDTACHFNKLGIAYPVGCGYDYLVAFVDKCHYYVAYRLLGTVGTRDLVDGILEVVLVLQLVYNGLTQSGVSRYGRVA